MPSESNEVLLARIDERTKNMAKDITDLKTTVGNQAFKLGKTDQIARDAQGRAKGAYALAEKNDRKISGGNAVVAAIMAAAAGVIAYIRPGA